jgi:copper chaperone CopZ
MKVPSKDRKEWRQLVTGELDISFSNFFYQAKILQARTEIKRGKLSVDEAVEQIYDLTTQFCEAKYVSDDVENIFGVKIYDVTQDESVKVDIANIEAKVAENTQEDDAKNVSDEIQQADNVVEKSDETQVEDSVDETPDNVQEEKTKQQEMFSEQNIMLSDFKKKSVENSENQIEKKEIDDDLEAKRLEAKRLIDQRLKEEKERRIIAKKRAELQKNTLSQQKKVNKPVTKKVKIKKKVKKKSIWDNLFGK